MEVETVVPLILLIILAAVGVFFLYLGVTKNNRTDPDEPDS
ncbi:MAG: hypothetical protein P8J75_02435 [Actinomycetota bacterium]|nr:hypothetical protein [Actinomycetota bacterium]